MKKADGSAVNYQNFYGRGLQSDWGKMIDDVGASSAFLQKKYKVDPKNVAVGGASIGANVAFRYAVKNGQVPFAILLSPGMDYQGISTGDVMPDYHGRSLFVAVSPGDGYAYQSVQALQRLVSKDAFMFVSQEPPAAGHGVQMFRRDASGKPSALEQKIAEWMLSQKRK